MIASLVPAVILSVTVNHEFVFVAEPSVKSVTLAGTFNGWNSSALPLKRGADGTTWRLILPLRPGRHLYKFVLDGTHWTADPNAQTELDGDGNANSVLDLYPSDYALPAKLGDGIMAASVIKHNPATSDFNFYRGKARIRLTVRPNDVEKAWVIAAGRKHLLQTLVSDSMLEVREVELPFSSSRISYSFELKDGPKTFALGAGGLDSTKSFSISKSAIKEGQIPSWTAGTVLYQIFADRFANGSTANDPEGVEAWNAEPKYFNWFGGDIAGVRSKQGYLDSLGIGAIYFNPVFFGPSNHRYETTDYQKIDWRFGTNQEFAQLTRELKAKGIKTILDGVFNHTSTDYPAFADLRSKGEESRYKDWFFVQSYPITVDRTPNYMAWNGFGSMPKVNLENPEARASMLNVVDFWHKNAEIAGWRLDVANEVSMDFWRAFRKRVKSLNPDKWIIGEHWGEGSPWLQGDQWDSQMGYEFRQAAINWIAKGTWNAREASDHLFKVFNSYRPQVSHNLMNLLGSHDTPRFLSECGGDKRLAALGAALLLTWPGSPSIYYGDELGMDGGADPLNRRGMEWQRATPDNQLLKHYQKLIALRNSRPALKTGDPKPLQLKSDQVLGFSRIEGPDRCLVFINRSHKEQVIDLPLDQDWQSWSRRKLRDGLGSAAIVRPHRGVLRLTLAPTSGAVILAN